MLNLSIEMCKSSPKIAGCLAIGVIISVMALKKLAGRGVCWLCNGGCQRIDKLIKSIFVCLPRSETQSTKCKLDNIKPESLDYPSKNVEDLQPAELNTLNNFLQGLQKLNKKDSFVYVDTTLDSQPAGWYNQSHVSYVMQFSNNPLVKSGLQVNAEKNGLFLFVLSFSNCHSCIKIAEPPIILLDPMPALSQREISFPNVEFYFQYFKRAFHVSTITNPDIKMAEINKCKNYFNDSTYKNPNGAYSIGHEGLEGFDAKGWDEIKVKVMEGAIFAKFSQNPLLREMLKATAIDSRRLLQLKTDAIWGPGSDGQGANLLGVCLMKVRKALLEGKQIEPYRLPGK
jgi:ribA/ribD-fused uncharacterized protein